ILTGHNHPAQDWRATTAALILALEQDPRASVHVTENIDDLATSRPTAGPSLEGKRAQSRAGALPSAGGAAVELRSADFSPPPSPLAKAAGSGLKSALQVPRNSLNSTAVGAGGGSANVSGHNIFDYDLLVLNYCNWERPGLSDAAKSNFVRYLENGGGLAIVHFANGAWHPSLPNTNTADSWLEFYSRICRRVWEHRPPNASGHDPFGPFRVEIGDAKHPITAGLQPFDTMDELYFRQQGEVPI